MKLKNKNRYVPKPEPYVDEMEGILPMRTEEEIGIAQEEFSDRVWYDRHQVRMQKMEDNGENIDPKIWKGALEKAKELEAKYGIENLGPYSKFDWGMINGKLSAINWVLGMDWDVLDT